jgi:hypothetical protein
MAKHPSQSIIARARTEARARKQADVEQRAGAHNILHPHEVSGEYNAGRALQTTFGGSRRYLTLADLAAFRRNIATIGKRYKGGITAQDVIDRSLPADRDRANRQIKTAIPAWAKQGTIHFVTNAGPESKVTRHHVDVVFMAHDAAVASPKKADTILARTEALGNLRIECDCEHWRYRYRFIATIGNYNARRPEEGYPKITNPHLRGVACKHVLRVMKNITSGATLGAIARMIQADRTALATGTTKAATLTEAQADKLARKQHRESGLQQNRIMSPKERQAHQRLRSSIRSRLQEKSRMVTGGPTAAQVRALAEARRKLAELQKIGAISPAQLEAALAALKVKP